MILLCMVERAACYIWSCEMQALGDDPLVGNCSISRCIPQTVKDDEQDDFESWDDDDACERDPNSDGSRDVVRVSLSSVW